MCLILLAWRVHDDYPLVVAANRDEFFIRPSTRADFWPAGQRVLGGRDLEAGGSWLGISQTLRFAAITNFREGGKQLPQAPSRGGLVASFLTGTDDIETFSSKLVDCAQQYNGFNLLFCDGKRMGYFTNRGPHSGPLPPGIYGLSNHLLDTPWPKLSSAKNAFSNALTHLPESRAFFELLADRESIPDEALPATGVPIEWERVLSSVFVVSPDYGTRASTLLTVDRRGQAVFIERSFGVGGKLLGEVRHAFQSSVISTGV